MPEPVTKLSLLKAAVAASDWPRALSIAAKFPNLGRHKADITRAYNAIRSPDFYRQIGCDPEVLITAGKRALIERYRLDDISSSSCSC